MLTIEQKAALDLALLNLKTHGDDQLLCAVQPLIDFYEARANLASGYISEHEISKLLPGPYYMDPPDGGSVSVFEQLKRMADDAAKYRANLASGQSAENRGTALYHPALGGVANSANAAVHIATPNLPLSLLNAHPPTRRRRRD